MNNFKKQISTCLLAAAVLFGGTVYAASAPLLGAASDFAVLSTAPQNGGAVTCTDSTITGDVGSSGFAEAVVQTRCTITGAITAPVSTEVLTDFDDAYAELAVLSCNRVLTGTLANVTLTPGVYCFDAAAVLTGTLTLAGPANGIWIFKVGTSGTGALTGTNFSVVMANGAKACNVYWWTAEAVTMTTSNLKGTILSGAAITFTGGTFAGQALARAAVTLTGVVTAGCESGNTPLPECKPDHGHKGHDHNHHGHKDHDHKDHKGHKDHDYNNHKDGKSRK